MGVCWHQGFSSLMVHLWCKRIITLDFFLSSLWLFSRVSGVFVRACVSKSIFFLHRWLFARVFLIPQEPRRPKRVDGENNQSEPAWKQEKKPVCYFFFFSLRPAASLIEDSFTPVTPVLGQGFIPAPSRSTFLGLLVSWSAAWSSSPVNGVPVQSSKGHCGSTCGEWLRERHFHPITHRTTTCVEVRLNCNMQP